MALFWQHKRPTPVQPAIRLSPTAIAVLLQMQQGRPDAPERDEHRDDSRKAA
ncbi:MAG: hypothetical protein U0P82_05690 [Vicinamibacterales bacterium]